MLASVPLLIIPFLLYNLGLTGMLGEGPAGPWANVLFTVPMMSGGVFSLTVGDLMVLVALALLFVEILKATRTARGSIVDHLLSIVVFIAYLVEFLLVDGAARSLFFTLMAISLVDVLAGFSVSLRAASRDVTFGR